MIGYIFIAILIIICFFLFKKPKYFEKIKKFFNDKVLDKYLLPEFKVDHNSITRSSIELMKDVKTFSDKILVRSFKYANDDDYKDFGYFFCCTGRKCIGFEMVLPPIVTESITDNITKTIQRFDDIPDLVVEIKTISSKNIDWYCENIKKISNCKINVGNAPILKDAIEDRIVKLKQYTEEISISGELKFFARDLRTFIFFTFPPKTSTELLRDVFGTVKSAIDGLIGVSGQDLMVLYNEILKNEKTDVFFDTHQPMNTQIARGVEIDIADKNGIIKIGKDKFARILTTKKYPVHTNATIVQNAFFPFDGSRENPLAGSFMANLTIHYSNSKRLKKDILKKAGNNLRQVGGFLESKEGKKQGALKPELKEVVQESRDVIEYVNNGEKIAEAFYSLTIFENNTERLKKSCEAIKRSFRNIESGGWELDEERIPLTAISVFIHSLPLNFETQTKEFINRYNLYFSSNISAVMPLIGCFKGNQRPVLKFLNRNGQVCGIDFFSSITNYNCCIIGQSGTGKSFLTNSIVLSHLQVGTKVVVFDIGKSYKPLNDLVKGEFIVFDDKDKICLNFFTNAIEEIKSLDELKGLDYIKVSNLDILISSVKDINVNGIRVIDEDSIESIVKIVGAMAGLKLVPNEPMTDEITLKKNFIFSAVQGAYINKNRDAGMNDVYNMLIQFKEREKEQKNREIIDSLLVSLQQYGTPDGQYSKLFNGACSVDVNSDFTLIETEEIAGKTLYPIIYLSMLERVVQDFFFNNDRQKLAVFDESAPLLADPLISSYLSDFARRLRKYKASLVVITQNPEDFYVNDNARGVWQNSAFKFILPVSNVEQYFQEGKIFNSFNDYQKALLSRVNSFVPNYSEIMVVAGTVSDILRLKVTPLEYSIFTTNPHDKAKREEYVKKFSLTENQGVLYYAMLREGIYSESEILERVKLKTSGDEKQYWINVINKAIRGIDEENQILFSMQPIFNRDREVVAFEFFLKIKSIREEKEIVSGIKDFGLIAIDNNKLERLHGKMIKNIFEFSKEKGITTVSINVDNTELKESYFSYFDKYFNGFDGKIYLEINSGFLKEKNLEYIIGFIETLKQYNKTRIEKGLNPNIEIIISGVDLDLNLEMINLVKPIAIKVDGKLINHIIKNYDENGIEKLNLFVQIGKTYGIYIIAMHIESMEVFDFVKNIGFDFFQGYALKKPFLSKDYDSECENV